MKVALVLLSCLAVGTPTRRYPPYGGGLGGGSGGGSPIVFPGLGSGGVGVGQIPGGGIGGGVGGFLPPIGHEESQPLYLDACGKYNSPIHDVFQGSKYHFSWCVDGGKRYVWQDAFNYCKGLGLGWAPVSIESALEDKYVINIIGKHRSPWIWTSGNRLKNEKFIWEWTNGLPFTYTNWAKTGFSGVPQPDNSEDNNERCLGILNQFYPGDFITWHDIGCHHLKPTICEYSAGGVSGGVIGGGISGGGISGGGIVGGGISGGGISGGGIGRPQYG